VKRIGILLILVASVAFSQYVVEVQVVDLQVSVVDSAGNYLTELAPEDFEVQENGVLQEVLDLETIRQPFSIGILVDTSSSMERSQKLALKATEDFVYSLHPDDQFFLMAFSADLKVREFAAASRRTEMNLDGIKTGGSTRLYDAVIAAVDYLKGAKYPHRALFIISDGVNTSGKGSLKQAIETAQRSKVLVYSLVIEKRESDLLTLTSLSESTGGSFFVLYGEFPRLQAAYQKIAADLANRFTLYYRSTSDYTGKRKPEIKLQFKRPGFRVHYQKTYWPEPKNPTGGE